MTIESLRKPKLPAIVFLLSLAFVFCILAGCSSNEDQADMSPKDPKAIVEDAFLASPAAPWTWVRENPAAHKIDQGLLILLEPGGLMGEGKDAKNILVRPLPPQAKSVSVCVEANHEAQYEQAGLILYHDDDNYIKLMKEFVDGQTWIVLVAEAAANPRVVNKIPSPPNPTWVGFNFAVKGASAVCWGSDGAVTQVGGADFTMQPSPRIGVFTQSGQPNANRWARFADFKISSEFCAPSLD
ncbi:MAG: DUF1349 domain-containing protein [Candidatus Omnitrophota bacterium]